ncbi:hypothetical protein K504DRAFT_457502 [Pleomassaria siparia CBS 279.74]|uniref:Uncharacterized protein n=1 Tax=Pleomassaria siparia CBS 279.74 TaxID=1314801 RepID=A0A6G1KSM7_9PLEO|nr:hypothetical protein K504DRAFT_457502 [Pleomassaria siparia CBS 279.74]
MPADRRRPKLKINRNITPAWQRNFRPARLQLPDDAVGSRPEVKARAHPTRIATGNPGRAHRVQTPAVNTSFYGEPPKAGASSQHEILEVNNPVQNQLVPDVTPATSASFRGVVPGAWTSFSSFGSTSGASLQNPVEPTTTAHPFGYFKQATPQSKASARPHNNPTRIPPTRNGLPVASETSAQQTRDSTSYGQRNLRMECMLGAKMGKSASKPDNRMQSLYQLNENEVQKVKKTGRRPSLHDTVEKPGQEEKDRRARRSSIRNSSYFDAVEDQEDGDDRDVTLGAIEEGEDEDEVMDTEPGSQKSRSIPNLRNVTARQPRETSFSRENLYAEHVSRNDTPSYLSAHNEARAPATHSSHQHHTSQHQVLFSGKERAYPVQESFNASHTFVVDPDPEFDDLIVLADIPYPFSGGRLPCTRASTITTARMKAHAVSLMIYDESPELYSELMKRLDRMLDLEIEIVLQDRMGLLPRPSLSKLARKMRDWLRKIEAGRITTGEELRVVEHEARLADFIVEACQEGVMHVRNRMCRCGTNWEMP